MSVRTPPQRWLGSVNAVVVRAVQRAGQMTVHEVRAHLMEALGVEPPYQLTARRLRWLRDCAWLVNTSSGTHTAAWRLTPQAVGYLATHGHEWLPASLGPAGAPRAAAPLPPAPRRPPAAAPVAPPPQRNVLHTPVWRPPAWQPARAGADDHKQYATRGVRC